VAAGGETSYERIIAGFTTAVAVRRIRIGRLVTRRWEAGRAAIRFCGRSFRQTTAARPVEDHQFVRWAGGGFGD
jgi:hypothetical protein